MNITQKILSQVIYTVNSGIVHYHESQKNGLVYLNKLRSLGYEDNGLFIASQTLRGWNHEQIA